jgi:hypothetical protein
MALLSATQLATTGTAGNPVAIGTSNTISGHLAALGAVLEIKNGSAASINVTFTDPGRTPAGNTGTQAAVAIAAGATMRWRLATALVDQATNLITVAVSAATSVTYELYY